MSGSFLTVAGAFLKLGNFGLGFGAEKNDESDRESLTGRNTGLASFFIATLEDDAAGVTATFFMGGGALAAGGSFSFRFFSFASEIKVSARRVAETNWRDLPSVGLLSASFVAVSTN